MSLFFAETPPIYRPLDASLQEVRLLEVSRSLDGGRISCRLTHAPLRDAKFVVLSYRWGAEDPSHQILLNDQVFNVRSNLKEFLDVIREQSGMFLWIDALCINQADTDERSQQVQIMGDIFRSASMVLSWLGPSNDATSAIGRAFDLMSLVWTSSSVSPTRGVRASDQDQQQWQYDPLPSLQDGVAEDEMWQSVSFLCSLMYWNRVWVVQEVMLSSNNYLLYGNKPLAWQIFANFLSLIDVRFKCPTQYARSIQNSTAKSYAISKPYKTFPESLQWQIGNQLKYDFGKVWDVHEHNLFRILSMFGDRDCTDALDHVYALLSLTSEGQGFPVKYGINPVRLFETVFHFCGEMMAQGQQDTFVSEVFWPASQRAFFRNTRYLAEIMDLVPSLVRTQPYFHRGAHLNRGPNPKPDPCFPCKHHLLALKCHVVESGNEPPVLRSNTLQRSISRFAFDLLLHIEESNSWVLCEVLPDIGEAVIVAFLTIKDSVHGRGFKIIEPGPLSACKISQLQKEYIDGFWTLIVLPECHLSFLKAVILSEQPI